MNPFTAWFLPPRTQPVLAREHFALNTSSAVIQLVTNASLDYESIEAYDITIRAQDNGTPSLYRLVHRPVWLGEAHGDLGQAALESISISMTIIGLHHGLQIQKGLG